MINKNINKNGFTIAELMIIMLILSIVLAAAMPVVTKRKAASTQSQFPIGAVMAWPSATIPTSMAANWCFCDGKAISQTTYPELYTMLGTNYDPATTKTSHLFPDARGRLIVGLDTGGANLAGAATVGATGGAQTHTMTIQEMPSHFHSISDDGSHTHPIVASGSHFHTTSSKGSHSHGGFTGAESSHIHVTYYGGVIILTGLSFSSPNSEGSLSGVGTTAYNIIAGSGSQAYSTSSAAHSHGIINAYSHSHTGIINNTAHSHSVLNDVGHTHTVGANGTTTPYSILQPYQITQYIIKCK